MFPDKNLSHYSHLQFIPFFNILKSLSTKWNSVYYISFPFIIIGIGNFLIGCVMLLYIPRRLILSVKSTTNPPRKQCMFKILTSMPVSISNCILLVFMWVDWQLIWLVFFNFDMKWQQFHLVSIPAYRCNSGRWHYDYKISISYKSLLLN